MIHFIMFILLFFLHSAQEVAERMKTRAAKKLKLRYHYLQGFFYGVLAVYWVLAYPYTGHVLMMDNGVLMPSKWQTILLKIHSWFVIDNMVVYITVGGLLAVFFRSPFMGVLAGKGLYYVGLTEKFFNKTFWQADEYGYANMVNFYFIRLVILPIAIFLTLKYL